jgi:DnaJ homolog subfamily B member 12
MFDTGPQFVFNLGGGPGIRVHQFGGARPRRRPREANAAEDRPQNFTSTIASLLPLLILFILPLLSQLLPGDSTSNGPQIHLTTPKPPFTLYRQTLKLKVDYYVNPADVGDPAAYNFKKLDDFAEVTRVQQLRAECGAEQQTRQRMVDAAQGWFFQDERMMQQARTMEMRSCQKLQDMKVSIQ